MYVAVKNQTGETVESIELNDAVFNVPMNQSLVHQAMVIYQSNRRQGTHATKTRSEVSGGGRKPWIQKHTGRARQGSTRSPQWRHGGVVFGPHPRSYRKALPKRMKRQALRCVLSDKVRNNRIVCLDSMDGIDGKTRSMIGLLDRLNVTSSALVVTMGSEREVVQAAGNLKKIYTLPVNQLNAEALLARDVLILTVQAVRWAEETLASDPHGRRGRKFAGLSVDDESPVQPESEVTGESESVAYEDHGKAAESPEAESAEVTETDQPQDGE
jgi:large subunit ribosomal protein L4